MTRATVTTRFAACAALLCLHAAGCDWRKFDEIVASAPVRSIGPPGGYIADDVGRLLVPLPPGEATDGAPAKFLFLSISRFAGALVELDAQGKATVYEVPVSISDSLQVPGISFVPPLRAAAVLDGAQILVGTPDYGPPNAVKRGRTSRLRIDAGPVFRLEPHVGLHVGDMTDANWGAGIAVGHVGDAATDTAPAQFLDHVVVSQRKVTYLENGIETGRIIPASGKCPTAIVGDFAGDHRFLYPRAVTIADVLPGGQGEILVGVPQDGEAASGIVQVAVKRATTEEQKAVLMANGHLASVDHLLECPVYLTAGADAAAPTLLRSRARFGVSIAHGDFNGDGKPDILVGAPPDRAYVFLGPLVASFDPLQAPVAVAGIPIVPPAGIEGTQSQFGLRVAAGDIDGDGTAEMLIGAPDAVSRGQGSAGAIFVYKYGNPQPLVVRDAQPQPGARLGHDVAAIRFRAPACMTTMQPARTRDILLGGSQTEVFAYFGLPTGAGFTPAPDLRCR